MGDLVALVRSELADDLRDLGLDRPWQLLAESTRSAGSLGRGARTTIPWREQVLFLKQYMRGGWLAAINSRRYGSPQRFLRELNVGEVARRAGCPVVAPWGCLLKRSGWGWLAWGVTEFVEDAPNLAEMLEKADEGQTRAVWSAVLACIDDFHSRGLLHADLNLGNLLVGRRSELYEIRVIDLDKARWFEGGVPNERRVQALARLNRSHEKIFSKPSPQILAAIS